MKAKYLFHDELNTSYYRGDADVSSFKTGLATTNFFGTFTNTSDKKITSTIHVMLALTEKSIKNVNDMNKRIKNDKCPVSYCIFVPSSSWTTWSRANQNDYRFWASLPSGNIEPGVTVSGVYIPLTALPPFSSRAEIGTVLPESVTVSISDYLKCASVYLNPFLKSFKERVDASEAYITVNDVPSNYSLKFVPVANANIYYTFSNMIRQAVNYGKPTVRLSITSLTESKGGFIVNYHFDTEIKGKPKESIPNKQGRFENFAGANSLGESGILNNHDLSLANVRTKQPVETDTDQIYINNKAFTIAGIDYYDKKTYGLNLHV